jgi:hypothetical protein
MAKGIPFKYGRGRCIFCMRHPPEVKITAEHLFGDWLRALFPRDATTTHTYGLITWPTPGSGLTRAVVQSEQKQGHTGSRKLKFVCRACNEIWLSNLVEDAAKPILSSLINSEPLTINAEMQRILATWAAKTVMVAEYINRDKVSIKQEDRTWLKEHLIPPPGWWIWIGSYAGQDWRQLGIFQHPGKLEIPSVSDGAPTEHNLELTMIGMGDLLFLVINSSWSHIWDIIDRIGNPSRNVARIWPITTEDIAWPKWDVITDAQAEYLTTYLARILEQPVEPSIGSD